MRTDSQLAPALRDAKSWENYRSRLFVQAGKERNSFSGHERNRLFLSDGAKRFIDVSALSGLDSPADSRSFVIWDFDRDGWQDIACVSANAPLLQVFHNRIGQQPDSGPGGNMIALSFRGANHSDRPATGRGPRDGYGAKVTVVAGDLPLIREHRCGEGMAAQNSATMLVGIGPHRTAKSVTVRWPSGASQEIPDVPAGTLLTLYEDPAQGPSGDAATRAKYRSDVRLRQAEVTADAKTRLVLPTLAKPSTDGGKSPSRLIVLGAMATWCDACQRHLPLWRRLRGAMDDESLGFYGVPVDESEPRERLLEYVRRHRPAYQMLTQLTPQEREGVKQILRDALKSDALPATVVTDARGTVLLTTPGLPTVSQLREIRRFLKLRAK